MSPGLTGAAFSQERVQRLGLVCGIGQLLAVHLSYILAANAGHVPWCIPYWESCTSISATGRRMPEALLFKGMMLPLAVCIVFYWHHAGRWLTQRSLVTDRARRWMFGLGTGGAISLACYTLLLGADGQAVRLLRHIPAILSFTLTFLAQLLLARSVWRSAGPHGRCGPPWLAHALLGLSTVTLLTGISSVLLDLVYSGYDAIEDAIEWNLAALLNIQFILTFFLTDPAQRPAPQPSSPETGSD